jgi:hypothetical protein
MTPVAHLLFAMLVQAQPSEQVFWEAPAGCPDQSEVRTRVDEMLATGGSGRRDPVQLRMVVRTTRTSFRLTASLADDAGALGRRVVEAVNCEDLASAAVLIAALAIDPDIVPPEPDVVPPEPNVDADEPIGGEDDLGSDEAEPELQRPDSSPDPNPEHPVATETTETTETDDARLLEAPRELAGVVHLGVGLGLGRLAAPMPMLLGRLAAGLEQGAFRGLLRVSGFGPSTGDVPGFSGGGRFGAFTGGIAGCGRTRGTPWAFVGCLATDLGIALGRGLGTQNTRSNRSLWWGVEAEAAVEYALNRRWSLTGSVEGGVMPVRTRFIIDGQGHACCVRWSAGMRLGVLARFGRTRS